MPWQRLDDLDDDEVLDDEDFDEDDEDLDDDLEDLEEDPDEDETWQVALALTS